VRSWGDWVDLPERVGDRLGRAALGAAPGQVIIADSTTVNLYKLVGAALDARLGRSAIVYDAGDFPTDLFVAMGLAHARRLDARAARPAEAERVIDRDVAIVMFSAVDYRTAELADAESVTAAAHGAGALMHWDLSHAAGALDVRLDEWDVDLATGWTYKYLNAGPGAPAWLYVRDALQDVLVSLLEEAGIGGVRAKGMTLTQFAIEVADERLTPRGFTVGPPRAPERLGSHVALHHPEAYRLSRALIEEASTVPTSVRRTCCASGWRRSRPASSKCGTGSTASAASTSHVRGRVTTRSRRG
jgi:kynureninase